MRGSRAHQWLILVTLLIAAFPHLFARREAVKWKQYTYSDDGFSVMFPDSPRIYPDRSLPDTTTYSANINPDYAVTLRVKHSVRDCNAVIQQLRANVQAGKDAIPIIAEKIAVWIGI